MENCKFGDYTGVVTLNPVYHGYLRPYSEIKTTTKACNKSAIQVVETQSYWVVKQLDFDTLSWHDWHQLIYQLSRLCCLKQTV